MKRFGFLLVAALISLALVGCQRDTGPIMEKLDELSARVEKIESGSGGSARGGGGDEGNEQPQRRPGRPDPSEVYAVPVGDSPSMGPENAKVTIVEAFEFACGYCRRVHPTVKKILDEYGDEVRVVWKNFLVHPDRATTPALAACAAGEQGKYLEMTDLIWENGFPRDLGEENMKTLAGQLDLDMGQFEADMSGDACKTQLNEDMQMLRKFGTRGTPNFYINGRALSGARPYDAFKQVIDEEIAKADERISEGTPAEEYYAKYVIEEGKKSL